MISRTPDASARLLPWAGSGGKPCYVIGDGTGYVSHVADNVESVQLGMALELLDHADDMLDDRQVTSAQLRYVVARMAESLRDVHRIARSRGERLAAAICEGSSSPRSRD
ncbi:MULTISPECIES: hypothetical protein [unclassified Streptomyces]|uniref:hypothetical protein n=1 Tax=unclassified Streptomyces TaxID=2593676 RepID=UPI002E799228|nr:MULTISPECIES: hypothetical protein [unclassified Streptomyces]MEE1743091.1 hypothetical protein [Streptomyces sp. JV184]MEE1843336.1 hypothetical protein [Streptomyces sp. JV190]